ncbi:uncharacterized protein [Typha latifolia]|uniref:uncharacterized protein n=1 Tax=Typha latifolia TaxID=4733 RepID=UPI003C2BF7D0
MGCHLRSASLPSSPNPLVLNVEEELQKLKACAASSSAPQMMCDALKGVRDLYVRIEELFCLPSNQNIISHPQCKKWLEEELEVSVRFLDLCGALQDNFGAMRMCIQDLQCALRREGASAIESKVRAFIRLTKKANKDVRKQTRNKCGPISLIKEDNDLSTVVRLLIEAREIIVSILQSALSFLSTQIVEPKTSKWSPVSKMFHKQKVARNEEQEDETFGLSSYFCKDLDDGSLPKAQKQLMSLEVSIGGLESGVEFLFRRLIQTRVALLNILSS